MIRTFTRRRASSLLTIMTGLFFLSAASRGLEQDGAVHAALRAFFTSPAEAAAAEENASAADPQSTELPELLEVISEREAALEAREARIEERERALALAREEIAANLARLTAAEDALRATIALADGAAMRDLERLTDMYEQMKAREAAALFEAMDPNFAAGFLAQMAPEAAASILEGLTPEAAYLISTVMAGRNVGVPAQ